MSDDLNVLMPAQAITLGGREITVNELTFLQTLKLGSRLDPLMASLSGFLADPAANPLMATNAFNEHPSLTVELLHLSTGLSPEDIEQLSASKSYALLAVFFAVHQDFFAQKMVVAGMGEPINFDGPPSSLN